MVNIPSFRGLLPYRVCAHLADEAWLWAPRYRVVTATTKGETTTMDAARTQALAAQFLDSIRGHYEPGRGNDQVLEVLNALGSVAAVVLTGTGPDQSAIDFFNAAVGCELRGMTGGEELPGALNG